MYTVVETIKTPKFKELTQARRLAEELAKKKNRDVVILQIAKVVNPPRKAINIYFQITGLDWGNVFHMTGNQRELKIKRAWLAFVLAYTLNTPPKWIASQMGASYGTVYSYLKFIPEYVKQPEWITAKWQPLIKYIKTHYPELL